jgi:Domain of unknown function (DUF4082)/Bacterial Ig-like domain
VRRPYFSAPARLRVRFAKIRQWQWKLLFAAILLLSIPTVILAVHTVPAKATPCPCGIFSVPTGESTFHDVGATYELGVKFKSSIDGYITGIRFYKEGAMSGTHIGNLWNTGTQTNLATATFSSESASGWQSVTFGAPVAVTAGTMYVASVSIPDGNYIATPNYFNVDASNYPLTAPSGPNAGGNGVFATTPGTYPAFTSNNNSNYWVDVTFQGNPNATPPTVMGVTPTNGATGVLAGTTLTATFDEAMLPSSFSNSSFVVKDANNTIVTGSFSYNSSTKSMSFIPSQGFTQGATYTATVKSGAGGVANLENVPITNDFVWSFTVTATQTCPCSLQNRAGPKGSFGADDAGSIEVGVKVVPSENGFITALRFYKPVISTESTHTGNIWDSAGNKLASVTFSNESDYGWQEAVLSAPLAVSQGQTYIVSYGSTDAIYEYQANVLTSDMGSGMLKAYASGSASNNATGSGTYNSVYTYNAGSYPSSGSTNGSYYYVDAVFSPYSTTTIPLGVDRTIPGSGSYGVTASTVIRAYMDHALSAGTVNGVTVQVTDTNNNPVAGTVSYDTHNHYIAFTPTSTLDNGQKYKITLGSGVADTDGQSLANGYSWSFTVGSPLSTNPNAGPGGPILLVTSDSYSKYYAEILRTEGFNYFDVQDLSAVTSTMLANYRQVLLAQTTVTQGQADMFANWVSAGGDLVAMRPDAKLATLLGLTSVATTRTNQYFLTDTSVAPGQGIVGQTMQYKGVGDNYTLHGATAVATYYSDASTSTNNPAVTYRTVGSGVAAAFTFDLARSVIALHQGNQAWAGQDRDGSPPIRSNDLFYGAKTGDVQPDWVDINKIQIPQADEQQRLLGNILTEAAKAQPIPHFWYLPHDYKAAVVVAGDDHEVANSMGTERVMSNWIADSPTNCSLVDWQCVRATHYVYTNSPLTVSRALQFEDIGFEVGDHPIDGNPGSCNDYTSYANLLSMTTNALTNFRTKYVGLPNQRTTRYHCYVWSDWDSQPLADQALGIHYDLNMVNYPPSWIGSRPALINGSGMNMRYTDATGNIIDVHQGVTDFENSVTPASAIDGVLDNAQGSNGYYGLFGTHYDMNDSYDSTVYAEVSSRGTPMITADQALTWLDGRNSSTFSNFSGSQGKVNFTIAAAQGAVGLRAMMPLQDSGGSISTLTLAGTAVSYETQTIKGVQYAVFDATPGVYSVVYSDYSSTSGGGSNSSSSGGGTNAVTSSGEASSKRTGNSTTLMGSLQPSAQSLLNQQPANALPNTNSGTNGSTNKTIVQQASRKGSTTTRWLIGGGIVLFSGGLFAGIAIRWRHRNTQW